ncbi:MAG: hypothetical protein ACR2HJ_04830 [Fimbriimonadales bacterium]
MRRFRGTTRVTEEVVQPAVFEAEASVSVYVIPDNWGDVEVDAFQQDWKLDSGALQGLLEVTDDDLAAAGISPPVKTDSSGDRWNHLHYDIPALDDEERARLAKAVTRRLPACLLRPYVKPPRQ